MDNVIQGNFRRESIDDLSTPEFATLAELCSEYLVGTFGLERDKDAMHQSFAFFVDEGWLNLYQRGDGLCTGDSWGWLCALECEEVENIEENADPYLTLFGLHIKMRNLAIKQALWAMQNGGDSWQVVDGDPAQWEE